jgi:hypothetical protein
MLWDDGYLDSKACSEKPWNMQAMNSMQHALGWWLSLLYSMRWETLKKMCYMLNLEIFLPHAEVWFFVGVYILYKPRKWNVGEKAEKKRDVGKGGKKGRNNEGCGISRKWDVGENVILCYVILFNVLGQRTCYCMVITNSLVELILHLL